MTLRTKLSLALCALLSLSIGATGLILIYQSASNMRVELAASQQLFAENRAFALRDNLAILREELERIAGLPEVDLTDDNPAPEAQLLEAVHKNSVLYNTALLLLSAEGDCLGAVPDTPEYRNGRYGGRPWFRQIAASPVTSGPQFFVTEEPLAGRTIKIVEPIHRQGRFTGALVGVIALGQDNLITPALRDNLPPGTEALLVDATGRVLYPTDAYRAEPSSGWATAIQRASSAGGPGGSGGSGASGTLRAYASGEDSLFAFALVQASTGYALVFRWPWALLTHDLRYQKAVLAGILGFGILLAAGLGIAFAAYLTRPLKLLGEAARRIAMGKPLRAEALPRAERADELGALVRAFDHMERAIRQRDQELREAAALLEQRVDERTRELALAQQALVEVERYAAMGKTSAAIAHELKNAMGGLGMAVDLILQDPTQTARVERLHKQVNSEIARLRDVIDSLLSFSRAPRIDCAPEDLAAVVRRAVELLDDVITDRSARVEIDTADPLPVFCDGHKMQGVIMNLVRNAVEAGRLVRVAAFARNGEAIVEVSDDGPGFSEEARAHLFEPFFTTKPNGTGLGLPTSRRFVEAHGGRIEIGTATELGGAKLCVRVPREVKSS